MKNNLSVSLLATVLSATLAHGQLLILSDDYNVTGNGTGFVLDTGVNSGINPPTTRLTGSIAADLRYIQTFTGKAATAYSITDNKLVTALSANAGRFTLSADGTAAYDFSSVLGIAAATPANPVVYDIAISMANTVSGTTRFSFAVATTEDNANFWDFGLQLYRANSANDFYTIQKRVDRVSYTLETDSSGNTGDINAAITTLGAGTYGTEIDFLIRVTDAGAEASTFNSRVQLSMDGGGSWFYDTATDSALALGFRFDGLSRYFSWDQAGATSGTGDVTYDNFSVTLVPEPSTFALGMMGGLALLALRLRRNG
jgi:hypothetical protein